MHSQCPFYKLEDKQKSRTKLSMYPINTPSHIGEPKIDFSKSIKDITFFQLIDNQQITEITIYTNDRLRQM